MRRRLQTRRAVGGSWPLAAVAIAAALVVGGSGCWNRASEPVDDPGKLTINLRSPAFADGAMIPREHTCDGAGGSPPLEWSGVPQGARQLALIVDDSDAPMGTFSHWVVAGLPPDIGGLKAGVPADGAVPAASIAAAGNAESTAYVLQGKNDFGKIGYGGPCPPSGTHHYVFRLYALDATFTLKPETPTRSGVLEAIKGHILAEGRLVGNYARSK
jgi:Raf kinase inhibitor-like YbhB/YbcL family protein